MTIGIPRETRPLERRVAATPETATRLQKLGFSVLIEREAGVSADFPDSRYEAAGCRIASREEVYRASDVVLKVRAPQTDELPLLRSGQTLVASFRPAQEEELLKEFASRGVTAISMDQIPRISRAQKMDSLSSMANIAGYRAIIEAANLFPRFFTGQITAAGKVPPAKILVIGAGVAGLAAIGAGRALGAIVRAFDTRPAVKEQVQSMGAEFLEIKLAEDGTGEGGYAKEMSPEFIAAEMALFLKQAGEVDIIVTTALIPGRPAPKLITKEMVAAMREGSVIVDLAAEQGGNCELTEPGKLAVVKGVSIVGYTDLPSRMAAQSSQLFGTNLFHLMDEMGGSTKFRVDFENEVIRNAVVAHGGSVTWPPPKPPAPPEATKANTIIAPSAATNVAHGQKPQERTPKVRNAVLWITLASLALIGIGTSAPTSFLSHLTVFVLACFIGWQVIWNVTPALHTPLMSVTNAISGIIIIGGMLQLGTGNMTATILSTIAVLIATINIAGGFLVTQRMLKMFRK